jgi:hypothetical protein
MLREHAPGRRRPRSEREGLACDLLWQIFGWLQARRRVCNHDTGKGGIFGPLCERQGARHRAHGLHAREPAKPGELNLVVRESCHSRGIAFHRQVFDRDTKLRLEILAIGGEPFDQTRLIFVGDRGKHQCRHLGPSGTCRHSCGTCGCKAGDNSTPRNGHTSSPVPHCICVRQSTSGAARRSETSSVAQCLASHLTIDRSQIRYAYICMASVGRLQIALEIPINAVPLSATGP